MKSKRSGEIDEDNFKPPSEGEAITDGGRLGYRLIQVDVDCVVHPHAKSLKFCMDSSVGPNIQLLKKYNPVTPQERAGRRDRPGL